MVKPLFSLIMMGSLLWTVLTACANPAAETYQKGVEGGEKAINKARDVQKTIDQTKINLDPQQPATESGAPSP